MAGFSVKVVCWDGKTHLWKDQEEAMVKLLMESIVNKQGIVLTGEPLGTIAYAPGSIARAGISAKIK